MSVVTDELLEIAEEAAMNVADMFVPLQTYIRAALAAVAPLIAAQERERCAVVADALVADYNKQVQICLTNLSNMKAAERFAYRRSGAEVVSAAIHALEDAP